MMTIRVYLFILFIAIMFPAHILSQDSINNYNQQEPFQNNDDLISKYLLEDGDVHEKIEELIALARNDEGQGRKLDALRKIQAALILQKRIQKPDSIVFELNLAAGDMISLLDGRYALGFYQAATELLERVPSIDNNRRFFFYTNRAGVHVRLTENDSSIYYYKKALDVAKTIGRVSESSALNNIGFFYNHAYQYDSAEAYFHRAIHILGNPQNDIILYCAIRDNLAELFENEKDFTSALAIYQYNDSVFYSRKLHNRYASNRIKILATMHMLNMPGIHPQIASLEKYIDRHALSIKSPVTVRFYSFADTYYFDVGKRDEQLNYHQQYLHLIDSLDKRSDEQFHVLTQSMLTVQEAGFEAELNAHQLQLDKKRLELKAARGLILISVLSAGFIITILVLLIRKRKIQHQAARQLGESELRNKEMEARIIQQELELKKRDLTNVVLHNTQVYDSNQKMIGRLHEISQKNTSVEEKIRPLLFELQNQNQISERSIGLQSNIESVNAEFFEKLQLKFPELTKVESELCGYIRINLSSKDISILKNVAADSVKKSKNRLRKKLGLEVEEDLYEFIGRI